MSEVPRKITRRKAISAMGKAAAGIGAAVVVGGGAYAAYVASTPPRISTTTATTTATATATTSVTETTTITSSATSTTAQPVLNVGERIGLVRDTELEWNKLFPNAGFTVAIEEMPGDIVPKLQLLIAAGQAPHVIGFNQITMLPFTAPGNLLDLKEFPDFADLMTQRQYLPGVMDSVTFSDRVLGLPSTLTLGGTLIYNKALLQKAGFQDFRENKDLTWDDIIDAAKAIRSSSEGIWGYAQPGAPTTYQRDLWSWIAMQLGGATLVRTLEGGKYVYELTADSEPMVRALKLVYDMTQVNQAAPAQILDYTQIYDLMLKGKLGIQIEGSWWPGVAESFGAKKETLYQDYGMVVFPPFTGDWVTSGPTPLPVNKYVTQLAGYVYSIAQQAVQDEAVRKDAWDYLKWLTSDETQTKYVTRYTQGVLSTAAITSVKELTDDYFAAPSVDVALKGRAINWGAEWGILSRPEVEAEVEALQSVILGKATPEAAAKTMADKLGGLLPALPTAP